MAHFLLLFNYKSIPTDTVLNLDNIWVLSRSEEYYNAQIFKATKMLIVPSASHADRC